MKKYSVKKGDDGKYKLVKTAVKALNTIRPVSDILGDRIKNEKQGKQQR